MKLRNRKDVFKLLRRVVSTFCCSMLLMPLAAMAASPENTLDWKTSCGLVKKYGNETDGYNIISDGSSGYSAVNYLTPIDIMKTKISFVFDAWPVDPENAGKEMWGYISFTRNENEKEILHSDEDNIKNGCIELLFWHREDGVFAIDYYSGGYEPRLFTLENFDFNASHTICFVERLGGICLSIDGVALDSIYFDTQMALHTGDNAGKTTVRFGGQQGYSYKNIKFEEFEQKETEKKEYADKTDGSKKLGDLDTEDNKKNSDTVVEEKGFEIPLWGYITCGTVIAAAVIGTVTFIIIKKRRKKS